jgi:transposase
LGGFERFANTPEGSEALAGFCTRTGGELIVMEASGRYEQLAFLTLWRLGQSCAITNALAVRDFAKAMGRFEETDRIDAEVIARFGAAKPLVANSAAERGSEVTLAARLRQITSDTTIQKQRLSSAHDSFMRDSMLEIIASIATIIKTYPLSVVGQCDQSDSRSPSFG